MTTRVVTPALNGLVALTGAPYAMADYPTDPRFRHTSDLDPGVADEDWWRFWAYP